MTKTTHYLNHETKTLEINFDLESQESCSIQLSFTEKDIGKLMNMDVCGVYEMDLEGTSINCSRSKGPLNNQTISFLYKNGTDGKGSVYYNYLEVKVICTEAFNNILKSNW